MNIVIDSVKTLMKFTITKFANNTINTVSTVTDSITTLTQSTADKIADSCITVILPFVLPIIVIPLLLLISRCRKQNIIQLTETICRFAVAANCVYLTWWIVNPDGLGSLVSQYNFNDTYLRDIPSLGWLVDYMMCYVMAVIYLAYNCWSGQLKYTLMGPDMALVMRTRVVDKMPYVVYMLFIAFELVVWTPLVVKWDLTHCFLENFINYTGGMIYITNGVLIIYMLQLAMTWNSMIIHKNMTKYEILYDIFLVMIMIVAFLNAVIAMSLYYMLSKYRYNKTGKYGAMSIKIE
ncbi:MAG: hypothetical protein Faunusvirus7_5 [Faunusvirus sp.]|uniref:Uncharacterized protein n=1 Tax=Faunusvirus sp. TaxID=2487766 RepID=A0A3G4ZWH3_9VIRU|nr:MAG: hypothetical protein Faunusvirus7_5 [Faunusvirus sp.]